MNSTQAWLSAPQTTGDLTIKGTCTMTALNPKPEGRFYYYFPTPNFQCLQVPLLGTRHHSKHSLQQPRLTRPPP